MSRLDALIAELCPGGVNYEELGNLLRYEQPGKYLVESVDYDDAHATPVLTAGQTFILGYTAETSGIYQASGNEPVIIFDDFTTAFKWVDFPFKAKSSAMKMLTPNEIGLVSLRYAYYAMQTIRYLPQEHARQWIGTYSKFEIPVPPLDIQREIVNILDTFTALEAELEAELEARQKQYQYYRDELLSFDGRDDVRWLELSNVATYAKGRIESAELDSDTYVGVDNLLPDMRGRTKSSYVPTSGTSIRYEINDVLIGNIRPYLKKIWLADTVGGTNQDVLVIRVNDNSKPEINSRYLYHVLASEKFFAYNMQSAKGAKMPRGDKESIMRFEIPVPSLNEQDRIVSILDKFNALVNDISSGLPAEISARRKQYEHYRDRLLSFKEAA